MAKTKKKSQTRAKAAGRKTKKAAAKTAKRSKGKILSAKQNLQARLDQVNRVINRFEGEVEGLVKKLVKQGERSRKDLRKNFDDIVKKVRKGKIIARANQTRGELEREVKRLADEVIGSVKDVETLLNSQRVTGLLDNARRGIEQIVEIFTENDLVIQARQAAVTARKEVLGVFSIPTQSEVEKLERKIVSLEKRLNHLVRKAA